MIQVQAEIDVVNGGWAEVGLYAGLIETVGLMVYEGTQSLNYVKNYDDATSQWEGFPIIVDVTISDIMLGCKGSARSGDIMTLVGETMSQDLRGVMVWYYSVQWWGASSTRSPGTAPGLRVAWRPTSRP